MKGGFHGTLGTTLNPPLNFTQHNGHTVSILGIPSLFWEVTGEYPACSGKSGNTPSLLPGQLVFWEISTIKRTLKQAFFITRQLQEKSTTFNRHHFAEGRFRLAYKGTYTSGPKEGEECVVKENKESYTWNSTDWDMTIEIQKMF